MKIKRIIRMAVILLATAVFVFSAAQLIQYFGAIYKSKNIVGRLASRAVSSLKESDKAPISVDFDALRSENKDIIAWLYRTDSPINYPVVKSADNSDYLYKLTDGSYNINGTLFADCRSSVDFSDFNTVIYGHNMKVGTMFGTLPKYANQDYYDKHPVMYLFTPEKTYKAELVSGYVTESDSDIYTLPVTARQKRGFLKNAADSSLFKTNFSYGINDTFVTLSTCSGKDENARFVLICRLSELR